MQITANSIIGIETIIGLTITILGIVAARLKIKKNKSKSAIKNKRLIIDLIDHNVFGTLKKAVYEVKLQKYYTHKEFDKVKSKMCLDFTTKKAEQCKLYMTAVLYTEGIDTMNEDQLKSLVKETQNNMHTAYIDAVSKLWISKGISENDVEHVVQLFEKFRYDVVKAFSHRIESIFGGTYHGTNFDKMLAVYEMWAMGIDLLPRDMHVTFENLNGKFKDINY